MFSSDVTDDTPNTGPWNPFARPVAESPESPDNVSDEARIEAAIEAATQAATQALEATHRDQLKEVEAQWRQRVKDVEMRLGALTGILESLQPQLRGHAKRLSTDWARAAVAALFSDPPEELQSVLEARIVDAVCEQANREPLRIVIHPDREDVLDSVPEEQRTLFTLDPSVGLYGYRVEWSDQIVDGSLDALQERVREKVAELDAPAAPSEHVDSADRPT